MRILVTGAVVGNGGDAAIMQAQIATLRMAAAPTPVRMTIWDQQPVIASSRFPDAATGPMAYSVAARPQGRGRLGAAGRRASTAALLLAARSRGTTRWPMSAWPPGVRALVNVVADSDLVIYTGGTSLVDNYWLVPKLYDLELALAVGRPLVLFTQSLGPFHKPENRRGVRRVIEGARLVLLRDERSRQHLTDIGARTDHVHILPDVVFALADEAAIERARLAVAGTGRLRVAVSVRDWTFYRSRGVDEGRNHYFAALRRLVTWLVREREAEVVFLSTCQGLPEYWTDDSLVARRVTSELAEDVQSFVSVDSAAHTAEELRDSYGRFDVVVATRMHAAILALAGGTPVLPIAYEFKTRELFVGLGAGHLAVDIETLEVESLVHGMMELLDTLPQLRDPLFTRVSEFAARARRGAELALAQVDGA